MWYIVFISIFVCIIMALKMLFIPGRFKFKDVSFENFMFLGVTYAVIMVGFGMLYLLLGMRGLAVFTDTAAPMGAGGSFVSELSTAVYLSAVTLFSVGFGDVAPIGVGRFLAVIEALLGYTIPAAFVVRTFVDFDPRPKR